MRTHWSKALVILAVALMSTLFVPAAHADDDDPPSRVARLGYTYGSISFQPAGTDDWVLAGLNRPITTGDKLWADADSRAELHIGSASIRISSLTGFSFLNLTDNVTQIQLTSGTLRVRVKHLDENETFEIDTPNLAFSVLRSGVYRISVNEAGDTTVIKVRGGEGEITGGGSAFTLRPHEMGAFNGTDQLTADIEDLDNDNDDFDAWCNDRDRHEDRSVSARYVSPDVIGYQDLDDNGDWRMVSGYGQVWFPRTTIVGWAPYHYGHWAYISPWGYTWIDDAPWGFAPFHYGRWINYGGVWGWVPCPPPAAGVVYVRPVYAPALVAWVGGPHFAVGISAGGGFAAGVNVGWFPLGPREVFVPSYPVSRTYVTNVNVSNTVVNTTVVNNYYNTTIVNRNTTVINNNVTVIHQTYVNQNVAGAVTATTPQAFTSAQPVARNVVRVDAREVSSAPVNAYTPAVAPARQAVLGGGAAASVRPPAALQTRAVVAKVPPPPPPVTFARQQQAIQANGGRPLAISQVRQIQPQAAQQARPMVKIAPPSTPASPRNFQGNRPGQMQSAGGNSAGNPNNRPNAPGSGNSVQQPPSNGRPNTPANVGPPSAGNTPGANANGSNANQNRRSFDDRTPGAGGAGNAPVGNSTNANNNPGANNGNANQNRRTFNDRPPGANGAGNAPAGNSANTNNNPGANNGNSNQNRRSFDDRSPGAGGAGNAPAGNSANANNNPGANNSNSNQNRRSFNDRPAGAGGAGNAPAGSNGNANNNPGANNDNSNQNRRSFNDRPAGAGGAGSAPAGNSANANNNPRANNGNSNQNGRSFNDRPPAAGGAGNAPAGSSANANNNPGANNVQQKHDSQAQKPQQKQQERKDKSSDSKDDHHH